VFIIKKNQYELYVVGIIAILGIVACLATFMTPEELTALSLNETSHIIDANQTVYRLHGSTNINSTVYINSSKLNLSDYLTVDSNGDFSYDLNIPFNVTDCTINIYVSAKNKLNNSDSLHIERPATKLNLNSVNMSEKDTSLLISGVSEPNSNIQLSFSSVLNLTNASLAADSDGKFKYSINIPLDKDNFSIYANAHAIGKKSTTDSIFITRERTPEPVHESSAKTTTKANDSSGNFGNGYKYCYSSKKTEVYHTKNCGHLPQPENRIYTNTIPSNLRLCKFCGG
jgi:hypothetical protein